jgi:hypothetical protein
MTDNVGMLTVAEMESNATSTWVGVFVKIWDVGNPGGVREADPDGGGGVIEMGRSGELLHLI